MLNETDAGVALTETGRVAKSSCKFSWSLLQANLKGELSVLPALVYAIIAWPNLARDEQARPLHMVVSSKYY